MIPLSIQLKIISFSFFFGLFFFFCYQLVKRAIYCQNVYFRIINTFSFILLFTLLYFLGLERISDGILHIYSLILIMVGFVVGSTIARIRKK